MKILFATAQILSISSSDRLHLTTSSFGGWTMALIRQLRNYDIEVGIAMCAPIASLYSEVVDGMTIYILPIIGKNKQISDVDCDKVVTDFSPDLIQIEGTEFACQNTFSKNRGIKRLVSLQGILNGYEPYQYGQLPMDELLHSHTSIADRVSASILRFRKKHFFNDRLGLEIDTIANADYLTGRTSWDRAHSYWINREAKYYTCNRILRDDFYTSKWDPMHGSSHVVFASNGSSALKGVHNAIQAIALLKNEYPDVRLVVAGPHAAGKPSITRPKSLGYPLYLEQLITRLGVEDNIFFTGMLSESEMVQQLSRSSVYVLTSLIENSPNSLGEAMLMGVPCVSAYVGGVSDMATEREVLFYRANDPKMLAWQVKRLFDSEDLRNQLSNNAMRRARKTHDKAKNAKAMISAYEDILGLSIEKLS